MRWGRRHLPQQVHWLYVHSAFLQEPTQLAHLHLEAVNGKLMSSLYLQGYKVEEQIVDSGVLASVWLSNHPQATSELAAVHMEQVGFYEDKHLSRLYTPPTV